MAKIRIALLVSGLLFLPLFEVFSASLPKSTQEILNSLNVKASILSDIDQELQVPKDWLEKAKKEGRLNIRGTPFTPSEVRVFLGPFRERYSFLEVDYFGGNQANRSVKTLVAFRAGRILSDAVLSVGGFILEYKLANALENLRNIPAWRRSPDRAKEDPDGLWLGKSISYWCMSYNTKLVKKGDLPKKWDDLVTNPIWRNRNLALANRPQLWALNLWVAKGENWTKNFLTKLFSEVRPQLRKEGLSVLPQLAAAGEFYAGIPSSPARTSQMVMDGAPVGFTCPEPAPASTASVIILKNARNPYAARLFVNWLLSKEGQIAQFASKRFIPIHSDLQQTRFVPFGEEILGKEVSYSTPSLRVGVLPKVYEFWNHLWMRGPGTR